MGRTYKDHYSNRDLLSFSHDDEARRLAAAMQVNDAETLVEATGMSKKAAEHFIGRLFAEGQ